MHVKFEYISINTIIETENLSVGYLLINHSFNNIFNINPVINVTVNDIIPNKLLLVNVDNILSLIILSTFGLRTLYECCCVDLYIQKES